MILGVLRENTESERRVALVPEAVGKLVKASHTVMIQAGAGERAYLSDKDYEAAGAEIIQDASTILSRVDTLLLVRAPSL